MFLCLYFVPEKLLRRVGADPHWSGLRAGLTLSLRPSSRKGKILILKLTGRMTESTYWQATERSFDWIKEQLAKSSKGKGHKEL